MGGFSSFVPRNYDRADVDASGAPETCRTCGGSGDDGISVCVSCNGTGTRKYGPKIGAVPKDPETQS